jgi:glucan 1,4-alpha-glucosidase
MLGSSYHRVLWCWAAFCALSMQASELRASEYAVLSPNGQTRVTLACTDGQLSYSLAWKKTVILKASALSMIPDAQYSVTDAEARDINKSWRTSWGQFSQIRDTCRQITLKLTASGIHLELICRVYDQGVGLRFSIPKQKGVHDRPIRFVCEYNADADFQGHFPAGERAPIGPIRLSKWGQRPQTSYTMPALMDAGKEVFLGLLESDLYTAKSFKTAALSMQSGKAVMQSESSAKLTDQGLVTPWRVILLGAQAGALVTSTVPINLAAECKIKNDAWIKPGKCLWDWRVHGYQAGDFVYGINTASYLRFIDFAQRNSIAYFLIDDSWFEKVEAGKLIIKPEVDLKGIMDYAKARGVGILLYYDRHKGKSLGDEALFKLYRELGAVGIKYGFMGNNAAFTRTAVEQSAENQLMVNFHDGPCPMTGIRRTLPNALTREFCHAQQDARRAFSPTAFLKMAMVNALSGPLDQTNGAYGLNGINRGERTKGPKKKESYNATVVSESARTLVIFSGLICLPDAPEEYEKKADLFEFIQQMPATWDESRVINSQIGEYITTARRMGDQWFVGSIINEKGGRLPIPLDFLNRGWTYRVTFYEDAPGAHYINEREAYCIRKGKVTADDTIEAKLAPGGGHCMWIRPSQ